jgi:hypothetical protein
VNPPVQFPQLATAEKVIGEPGTPGFGEKVQEALKPFRKESTLLNRAKKELVLKPPFVLVCGTTPGLVMTFWVEMGENLMKLVPAPTMSKRILKSVWVGKMQLGFPVGFVGDGGAVLQLPPGPTVTARRA